MTSDPVMSAGILGIFQARSAGSVSETISFWGLPPGPGIITGTGEPRIANKPRRTDSASNFRAMASIGHQ
nr:uncharacterized protein CTRU02_00400 [Colletotrichum truncatum]KAF6801651.1 hypothetical protein CTRU02_00400 [Colletotrichum truncatum]